MGVSLGGIYMLPAENLPIICQVVALPAVRAGFYATGDVTSSSVSEEQQYQSLVCENQSGVPQDLYL